MTDQENSSKALRNAVGVLLCGCFVSSFSVAAWLTDGLFSQTLWPADINETIGRWLGGRVQNSLAGTTVLVVPWWGVLLRVAGGLAIILFAVKALTRNRAGASRELAGAVRRIGFALLSPLAWWLIWLLAEVGFESAGRLALGLLPLWLMMIPAIVVWSIAFACVPQGSPQGTRFGENRYVPFTLLLIAVVGWVGISFWLNGLLYQQVMIPHGDSAMYEEHLWNVWHGKGFRSYLDQGLFLGEHIQVIHLLLLPLHMLWPSHLLLELTESIALGSCSLIIYRMTLRTTGCHWAGFWMGLAWLCYFPMHFLDIAIDQKSFRPIVLGLPFLLGMIHFAERGRFVGTSICLILALSAKEDVALVCCPILAVIAVAQWRTQPEGKLWKWPLGLSVATGVYLVVTVLVVIPAFRSGEHVHYARYFGELGNTPGELIRTGFKDPLAVLSQAFRVQTFVMVAVFLMPLVFLPLRRPWFLLSGGITFGMLSLLQFSSDGADLPPVPYHHFHAPLLPVLFWAAIRALRPQKAGLPTVELADDSPNSGNQIPVSVEQVVRDNTQAVRYSSFVACCCLLTSVTGSLTPLGATFWSAESSFGYGQLYASSNPIRVQRATSLDGILNQIPVGARVASTDYVHTRLTHYERSYDYSDYLRAVNNYQPGVPEDTDFIILDTGHPYSRIRSAEDVSELTEDGSPWVLRPDLSNEVYLVLERAVR